MSNINNYIEEYGGKTFDELAFNEIDALVFSQLCYVDFSGILCKFDSETALSLKETAKAYFNLYSSEELENKISIVLKAGVLLKQCSMCKRFENVKLLKYVNNVNDKIDKQFSATTFYLNDELCVIAYRGTDTSITGIKEAAMLSYMFPVPAQIQGLYYLQESASISKRKVAVCGHSKGGNLATFAAINCSNSLKKNIIGVYEFDAPGFTREFINRYDYKELSSKIFSYIPQSSIIGCMLYHSNSRKVVKSINENIKQHQVSSWQIEGDKFVYADETDELSKFVDKYLKQLSKAVGEDKIEDLFETIFDFLEEAGINEYNDFKSFNITRFVNAVNSVKGITENEKVLLENTIKQAIKEFSHLLYQEKISSFTSKAHT